MSPRLFTGAPQSSEGPGYGREVRVVFVAVYHHLRFQASETAAPTSLLCAECSVLEAGGSLLGWNRHQVQLSPFGLWCCLVTVPRTTHLWVLRVKEDWEVHFGDEIPSNPCYCPWVGAKFCYEKCVIPTAVRGADSVFWMQWCPVWRRALCCLQNFHRNGPVTSWVSCGSLELVCADGSWPNVYLCTSPTSPLKIPFLRKMFIQINRSRRGM